MTIEQEAEPKDGGVPPAYWPSSGKLEVERLTARYSLVGASSLIADACLTIISPLRMGLKCYRTSASASREESALV